MTHNRKIQKKAAQCAAFFIGYVGGMMSIVHRNHPCPVRKWGQGLAVALIAVSVGQAEASPCQSDQIVIQSQSGDHRFSVEVADDARERARGLMFRKAMPQDAGMLFVYDKAQPVSFWMKNTLIPLDMIFTDPRGVIVLVHENAIPHDETPIFGGEAIFSVLELNAGVSKGKNIKIGDVLLHPAYDFFTSMPCDAK